MSANEYAVTPARIAAFRAPLAGFDVSVDEAAEAIRAATTDAAWASADVAFDGALRAVAGDELPFMHPAMRKYLRERVEVAVTAVLFTPADQ